MVAVGSVSPPGVELSNRAWQALGVALFRRLSTSSRKERKGGNRIASSDYAKHRAGSAYSR